MSVDLGVATQVTVVAGALDQLRDRWSEAQPRTLDALTAVGRAVDHLAQTTVGRRQFAEMLDEPHEAIHEFLLLRSCFREANHLVDAVGEDRVEQLFLGGESPIHRAHPNPCVVRDVIERRFQAPDSEQLTGRLHNPLPVELSVFAQPTARFVNHSSEFSDVPNASQ